MRLIDADLAKEMIVSHANEFSDLLNRREKALLIGGGTSCIDKCPTIEAEPVKHGRWVDRYNGEYVNPVYECSECKEAALYKHKVDALGNLYFAQALSAACPHCRAKMDGGADHADG